MWVRSEIWRTGPGKRGGVIARKLANADHHGIAWNRSREVANGIASVTIVDTVAAALQADVVFTLRATVR